MRITSFLLGFPLVLAGLIIGGCTEDPATIGDNSPPAGVTNEEEAMRALAAGDVFVVNEEQTFADEAVVPIDNGTLLTLAAPEITPISWGRMVSEVTVSTEMVISDGDSIATVTVVRDIGGTFHVTAKLSPNDTSMVVIKKPFTDQSMRNIVFRRVASDPIRYWLNWAPVSTSLVDGQTLNPPVDQVINLTEIQFVRPNGEIVTIDTPTDFYLRYHWKDLPSPLPVASAVASADVPEMTVGQTFSVNATLTSSSPYADVVMLRYGFGPSSAQRVTMSMTSETPNGDGTYTRVYGATSQVCDRPGLFQAGVLVLSNKTLSDDDPASYSANWWGVPYRVK